MPTIITKLFRIEPFFGKVSTNAFILNFYIKIFYWLVIDASAIPLGNGFIQSGGVSLGSFDECLEIDHQYVVNNENNQLRGKFCAPLLALPYSMLETIFGVSNFIAAR